jgi:hypothetical protein
MAQAPLQQLDRAALWRFNAVFMMAQRATPVDARNGCTHNFSVISTLWS